MKLTNLQIQFHGKDHLEHRITYVNENGTQCRETLCSGEKFAQHVIDCLEVVPVLTTERDDALERVTAQERHILHEINQSASAVLTKHLDCMADVYALVYGLATSATAPDTTQPQLSESRYVLHGDIQPCSVLYSDDTTTLLRLDEGDIMCETDTIEWSDSVTYRCQELLRSTVGETGKQGYRMVNAMAQLVRDERILLNDNGDDEVVPTLDERTQPVGTVEGASSNSPAGGVEPSCNNAYKHTDVYLAEESYRKMGYSTEQLVAAGMGHYVPAPAEPEHSIEQPCDECSHVFNAASMTCPVCNTIRPSKQER